LRFTLNTTTAIGIFGQSDPTTSSGYPGSYSSTSSAWNQWQGLILSCDDTGQFFTSGNKIWSTPPADGTTPASYFQGQPDFNSSTTFTTSSSTISGYYTAVQIGNRSYWSDSYRILSKAGSINSSNSNPDIILGHLNFAGTAVAPTTYNYQINPTKLVTDGTLLYAIDGPRIVGYSQTSSLTTSNQPIDFALGQPDLLSRVANNGGVNASTLSGTVNSMLSYQGKFFVVDSANNRVLIWNSSPSSNGAPADIVLGQATFNTNSTGTSLSAMNNPTGVAVLNNKLIVSDKGNKRLLIWNSIPTSSSTPADSSWDPTNFMFSLPSYYNSNALVPENVSSCGGRLYVNQTDRALVLPDIF
jgi:hypothetical protein